MGFGTHYNFGYGIVVPKVVQTASAFYRDLATHYIVTVFPL